MAYAKLDWVCRGCGSRLRKPRWIDLTILSLTVIVFIALVIGSGAFYIFIFETVFEVGSGWPILLGVLINIGFMFWLFAYFYPYMDFHRLKEARPHSSVPLHIPGDRYPSDL